MTCSTPAPTVHILLATYNGARFIKEQLESIARQTHSAWTLCVSDDGSTDDTLAIVSQFAKQVSQPVTVLHGPQRGSTYNFFHLIQQVQTNNTQDLYAFCDQDDVWLDQKLARAVRWHNSQHDHAVRLYCGRTQFVNEKLKPIGLSPGIRRPPSFGNALVQNIASGNTMVMSHAVLMAQRDILPQHSVWHDWTTYLIATAMGGQVCFDDESSLLYRQHGKNVIGSNANLKHNYAAFMASIRGRFRARLNTNLRAVNYLEEKLTNESTVMVKQLTDILSAKSISLKLRHWFHSGIHRQTGVSNVALALALILRKI